MSIDDSALRDPRVLRLAKALSWSRRETLGALLDVWTLCYDRVSSVLPREDIDTAANHDGFSAELERVGLGHDSPDGFALAGAAERILYLNGNHRENGRKGGRKRAENERARREVHDKHQAGASSGVEAGLSPSASASASALAPVSDPEKNPLYPPLRAKSKKPKSSSYTDAEVTSVRVVLAKLGKRNGVTYQVAEAHTKLIAARLREGITEMDLRKVIGYCCTVLEWQDKPEMARYLRPETLFGRETVRRYLDPARAWWEKLPADESGQKRPGATIHPLPASRSQKTENDAPARAGELVEGVMARFGGPMFDFGGDS